MVPNAAAPTPAPGDAGGDPTDTELPPGNPVVLIEGRRSVAIMEVISTDGRRNWSVRDVTEALGEPLKAVRRNRSVLESLHDRGVLAKEELPGGRGTTKKKVFYRLAAPWQAA